MSSTGVAQVRAGLGALAGADVPGLPDEQLRAEVLELLACLNQLTAVLLDRVGSFDVRDLSRVDALRASSTWLAEFGRMSKGAALRLLAHARTLAQLPALADGMRAGRVSGEQFARVVDLVRLVGVDQVTPFDGVLAELCATAGPVQVGKACERVAALVDPDGPQPDPAADFAKRELTFSQLGTMLYLRGRLDPEGAAALQTAIDALMRPPAPGDERTAPQRRADAMVDLARGALANGTLPEVGGERPQIGILITPEVLFGTGSPETPALDTPAASTALAGAGSSKAGVCPQRTDDLLSAAGVPGLPERPWLNWVGEITPQLAQRLACDSIVWRLVLDRRTGLPLDVGRKMRIVPWWMRKAIRARDRTCRWPGCDTPADWTDAHHLTFWWRNGTTRVEEILSLCRYHHVLVHEGQWTLRMDHATGEVTVRRPDGRPYELGPSRPWTSPSRQGPQHHPPWPAAA